MMNGLIPSIAIARHHLVIQGSECGCCDSLGPGAGLRLNFEHQQLTQTMSMLVKLDGLWWYPKKHYWALIAGGNHFWPNRI